MNIPFINLGLHEKMLSIWKGKNLSFSVESYSFVLSFSANSCGVGILSEGK